MAMYMQYAKTGIQQHLTHVVKNGNGENVSLGKGNLSTN